MIDLMFWQLKLARILVARYMVSSQKFGIRMENSTVSNLHFDFVTSYIVSSVYNLPWILG